jgi:1-acyl-sn-glycerol-3-phosphate acyltransferase
MSKPPFNHFVWIGPLTQTLSNSLYKFSIFGKEHLPSSGGYIVACNHVSYLDWMFLMAAVAPRPLRFMIDENFTNAPVFKQIIGFSQPIPVCVDTVKPRMIRNSMNRVVECLQAGDCVGMFPEGGLTRTGELRKFRLGVELLARQAGVPVVPAALTGLWGSSLSWSGGKIVFKLPPGVRVPVQLTFGEPLAAEVVRASLLHERVQTLLKK